MAVSISVFELQHLLSSGSPPQLVDVRRRHVAAAAPRAFANAVWRDPVQVADWAAALDPARDVVVYCVHGHHVSQGAADALGRSDLRVRFLEGGIAAWEAAGGATTARTVDGTRWITRARPRIDRIACPWLIARFIDRNATFHFAPAKRVRDEAERLGAVPFDVPGADLGHHGEACSFDAFVSAYRIDDAAMARLARIVRGADTNRLDLAPESAGLLAISTGLGSLFHDDHETLRHGMVVYDALYGWCCAQTQAQQAGTPTS